MLDFFKFLSTGERVGKLTLIRVGSWGKLTLISPALCVMEAIVLHVIVIKKYNETSQ